MEYRQKSLAMRTRLRRLPNGKLLDRGNPYIRILTGREPSLVVLGPCRGCLDWQLEYSDDVALEFCAISWDRSDPEAPKPVIDAQGFRDALESVLYDHMQECVVLNDYVRALGIAAEDDVHARGVPAGAVSRT